MRFILFIAVLFVATPSFAQESMGQRDRYVRQDCTPTPSDANASYPGAKHVIPYNNLAKPVGKPLAAEGQLIYLYGRVFDKNCVPLKGATVDIWQPNPFGEYVKPTKDELALPDPVFAGTGRAYTDTNGEFFFITLYPGPYAKRAPHIHAYISHPEAKNLKTTLYFAGDRRNADDLRYKRLFEPQRQKLSFDVMPRTDNSGILQGTIDIILNGSSTYRGF